MNTQKKYDPNAEAVREFVVDTCKTILMDAYPERHKDLATAETVACMTNNFVLAEKLLDGVMRQSDIIVEIGHEGFRSLGAPESVFRQDDDEGMHGWLSRNCEALAIAHPDDQRIKEFYQLHQMRLMVE